MWSFLFFSIYRLGIYILIFQTDPSFIISPSCSSPFNPLTRTHSLTYCCNTAQKPSAGIPAHFETKQTINLAHNTKTQMSISFKQGSNQVLLLTPVEFKRIYTSAYPGNSSGTLEYSHSDCVVTLANDSRANIE